MFIKYKNIKEKYNLNIKTILHVGAHLAEEHYDYFENGCEKVIWLEANPDLASVLKEKLDKRKNTVLNYVISDKDDELIKFMITNNGQSSSILELGEHKKIYPNIYVQKEISLVSKTLNSVFVENKLNFSEIDMINLDIQGAELKALKGIGNNYKNIKAIYTEINLTQVYKNCDLVEDIDKFLNNHGFKRVETHLDSCRVWGDALYIKQEGKS